MKLTAEKIQHNWAEFKNNITTYISNERASKLLDFYDKNPEFMILFSNISFA